MPLGVACVLGPEGGPEGLQVGRRRDQQLLRPHYSVLRCRGGTAGSEFDNRSRIAITIRTGIALNIDDVC